LLGKLFHPLPVGRLLGVPIRVSPLTGLLILLLLLEMGTRADLHAVGQLLLLLLLLVVSLLVHELAHALVGIRLGLNVLDITIWPFGGIARMDGLLERPALEGPVAAAGPIANLVLALLFLLLPGPFGELGLLINAVMGLANLLPAFPLDGGRILRSWLMRNAPPADATRAAVAVSNWMLVILLVFGIWSDTFWLTLSLCAFLYWAGRTELLQAMLRAGTTPTLEPGEVWARAFRNHKNFR
jgi:Zn-dependent protease